VRAVPAEGVIEARPELELTFLLAGTARRRRAAQARIGELAASVDFDALGVALAERRLLPLIGARLRDAVAAEVPESFVNRVAAATEHARAHAAGLRALAQRLVGELEAEGIDVLPLKGPFLSEAAHGDPALRLAADLDLLVRREHLAAAERVVVRLDYRPETGADEGDPELHRSLEHKALPPVEIHWRVDWYEEAFSRDMLARSARNGDGVRRAAPLDEFAALLLYFARDAFYGLRLAADIAGWWDRHEAGLEPGVLDRHESDYPELARSLRAAAGVAQRLAGVPAAEVLSSSTRIDGRTRLAMRLANWSQLGEADQLRANISLVDGLLAPRGQIGDFVRRQVLPPAAQIAEIYGPSDGTAGVGSRAAHAAKLLGRYLLALWRVRGGRRWMAEPKFR
jgi:hypothetical protein